MAAQTRRPKRINPSFPTLREVKLKNLAAFEFCLFTIFKFSLNDRQIHQSPVRSERLNFTVALSPTLTVSQLTIATQSTVHPAIHCVNPDCATPFPQKRSNKFCQSCGSPILLHNRYLPLQRLGHGGFAITYTVFDTQTQQQRVLKVLTETSPKAVALFEQEAQVLSSLRHPGIPQVEADSYFEIPVEHPTPRSLWGLVMEKINGQTLEDVLRQSPQGCSEAKVVNWFHQAIDVLQQLHQQQIIHRDLKPTNFMLRHETGQLVVIDFGGAKQMQWQPASVQPSSTRLISPGYSPPEQIAGGIVQPASDFYALGRTLIHLLTGCYPPDLEDPMTGELQWRSSAQVGDALADLLDEMVRFDVRQRPASADVIQARLCHIASLPTILRSASRLAAKEQSAISSQVKTVGQTILQSENAILPVHTNRSPQSQISQSTRRLAAPANSMATLVSPITSFSNALLDTTWSALLAGMGGGLGTLLGFELGYRSPLGVHFSFWLWENFRTFTSFLPFQFGAELFVFGAAGMGTALGLTLSRGLRQRRHSFPASLMGCLAYIGGLVGLRFAALDSILAGLVVFAELAAVFLFLGLKLPQPRLLHMIVAAIGTTLILVSLATANVWFVVDFWQFLYPEMPGVGPGASSDLACLILFSLLGGGMGCCLGISRYGIAPIFRGFR